MKNIVTNTVILQIIHHMCTITLMDKNIIHVLLPNEKLLHVTISFSLNCEQHDLITNVL